MTSHRWIFSFVLLIGACTSGDSWPFESQQGWPPPAPAVGTLTINVHGDGGNVELRPNLPGCVFGKPCSVFTDQVEIIPKPAEIARFSHWSGACELTGSCVPTFNKEHKDRVIDVYFGPKICRHGFCWENPLPQGNDLRKLWAHGDTIWAVGRSGTILVYEHGVWVGQESGTDGDLKAVWGTGPNDVWATGDGGTLLHSNGASWAPHSPKPPTSEILRAGCTLAGGEILLAGERGVLLRFDGSQWKQEVGAISGHLRGMWCDNGLVFVVGDDGIILERSASRVWTRHLNPQPSPQTLHTVFGFGPRDIWAAGKLGALLHYDGATWSQVSNPYPRGEVVDLWGSGPTDVWGVVVVPVVDGEDVPILHYDGSKWDSWTLTGEPQMSAVTGLSADEVWAVGMGGQMGKLIRNGPLERHRFRGMRHGLAQRLTSVWAASATEAWAVGLGGTVLQMRLGCYSQWNKTNITAQNLHKVVGRSTKAGGVTQEVTVVGESWTALRYDGASWSSLYTDPDRGDPSVSISGLWLSPSEPRGWMAGGAGWIFSLQQQLIRKHPSLLGTLNFKSIWEAHDGTIWIVGEQGTLLEMKGKVETSISGLDPTVSLNDVIEGDKSVWVVGTQGTILRRSTGAANFEVVAGGTGELFYDIDGQGRDLWIVGEVTRPSGSNTVQYGVLLHLENDRWVPVTVPTHQPLRGVARWSDDEIWLVGNGGTVLRRGMTQSAPSCAQ